MQQTLKGEEKMSIPRKIQFVFVLLVLAAMNAAAAVTTGAAS